jgi:hypothetical protein
MTIEMYVLGLLKFEDGKIVFREDELDKISDAIGECLKGKELVLPRTESKRRDGWRVYSLDPKKFRKKVPTKVKIRMAELGYCHHRVIVHFRLGLKGGAKRVFSSERIMTRKEYPVFREARDILKEETGKILDYCVKVKINELFPEEVRKEGEAKFIYTYPLIIIKAKYKKRKMIPFSDETSTLCFEIVEPSLLPFFGKKHLMKITIPSTILFTQKEIGETLFRDIVNAIYHFHFLDTMGGRTADIRIVRITRTTLLIAFLAFLVSVFSLILTLIIKFFLN